MTTPIINDKQKRLLDLLSKLINYGFECINEKPITLRNRKRKNLVLSIMGAVHNYSEGITQLLYQARTNTAEVVVRSLYEASVKLNYLHITGKSEINAWKFILDDEINRKKLAIKYKKFLTEHPHYKNVIGPFKTVKYCEDFIIKRDERIAFIINKYSKLNCLPSLRNMAIEVDNYNQSKQKNELKSRLDEWYLSIYWLLSNSAHLNSRGLNSFFIENDDKKITLNVSGNIQSLERIAVTTFIFYFYTLRVFNNLFKVGNKNIMKELKTELDMTINY